MGDNHEARTLEQAMLQYDKGYLTMYQVRKSCKTDLDFYNFLANHLGLKENQIKRLMRNVTGSDDAYKNALVMAEG